MGQNKISVGGSFEIKNTGVGPLHICALVLDDQAGVFQIEYPAAPQFTILPNNSEHVQIVLNQNAIPNQKYGATISVMSTDPSASQIDVAILATTLTPPKGYNVGGSIVIVDNFFDVACLEVHQIPGNEPPIIDLEKWTNLFIDPTPGQQETIDIYQVDLRNVPAELTLTIQKNYDTFVDAKFGPADGHLSVTIPESQLKEAKILTLADKESVHMRVSSYKLVSISKHPSAEPVLDMWASGEFATLASEKGLQVIRLKNPGDPQLISAYPEHKLVRLADNKEMLFGLSKQGLELFSLPPKLKHLSSVPFENVLGLAAGERSLVYVLTKKALFIIDSADGNDPTILHEYKPDRYYNQIVVIGSTLYLYGDAQLAAFSLNRPWLPKMICSVPLPNDQIISHWGTHITIRGLGGTQMYQFGKGGHLIRNVIYPKGHWADDFIADRHHRFILSFLPDRKGFRLWQVQRRLARAV